MNSRKISERKQFCCFSLFTYSVSGTAASGYPDRIRENGNPEEQVEFFSSFCY
jgi:hypothetical protein